MKVVCDTCVLRECITGVLAPTHSTTVFMRINVEDDFVPQILGPSFIVTREMRSLLT
jgi:hypothetical protein